MKGGRDRKHHSGSQDGKVSSESGGSLSEPRSGERARKMWGRGNISIWGEDEIKK